jgi:hypothetical protein
MVTNETIRHFFIQKLASIISQHSEKGLPFSPEESARIDWLVAEKFIDKHYSHWVSGAVREINETSQEKYDFEDFEKDYGFDVWDPLFVKSVASDLIFPFYENVWIYK